MRSRAGRRYSSFPYKYRVWYAPETEAPGSWLVFESVPYAWIGIVPCGVVDDDLVVPPETVLCWCGEREAVVVFDGSLVSLAGDFCEDLDCRFKVE